MALRRKRGKEVKGKTMFWLDTTYYLSLPRLQTENAAAGRRDGWGISARVHRSLIRDQGYLRQPASWRGGSLELDGLRPGGRAG